MDGGRIVEVGTWASFFHILLYMSILYERFEGCCPFLPAEWHSQRAAFERRFIRTVDKEAG